MEDLASALADAIVPHLDGPYAFFGHSMGAVVAFEVAQRLRDEGRPLPLHLFASGHRAPHIPYPRQPIHAVPNPRFREELALLGGTPQEILEHPELMGLLEPLLRADLELSETYRHGASSPLRCGITAFGGLADPHVPTGSIEAWRGHTQGPFRARFFPGDHFFLVPHARDLGVEIAADLQAVRPKAD
jgi:medium-chain acyl-[acyl-carrier-protein] hydrolase